MYVRASPDCLVASRSPFRALSLSGGITAFLGSLVLAVAGAQVVPAEIQGGCQASTVGSKSGTVNLTTGLRGWRSALDGQSVVLLEVGCVLQPMPRFIDANGYSEYQSLLGPARGVYESVSQTFLITLAVVIPPKASSQPLRAIGGTSLVVDWQATPCHGRGRPGTDRGAIGYI